jgi:hypothetical protein
MREVKLMLANEKPPRDAVILPATDAPNYYWHMGALEANVFAWEVYIAANQNRIIPTLFKCGEKTLFVGVEQGIFVINTETGEIINRITDTTYVQSIELISKKIVLVTSEDELIGFSSGGELLWRENLPDVIEDVEEKENEQIEVIDVSGGVYRLNVVTGKPVMK